MDTFDLSRRLAAEALGTGILVATVVGSGIMAETLTKDVALALLCNTLPTGAILVVLITVFGPISGAHFNPAVTLVFTGKREMPPQEAVLYMVAQIAGGIAGTMAAHLMFALPVVDFSMKTRTGGRPMVRGVRRRLRPGRDHPRRDPVPAHGGAVAGRPLHHGSVLVHRFDLVRQSGRRHRAFADEHVRGYPSR